MKTLAWLGLLLFTALHADDIKPMITPIPEHIEVDAKKEALGRKLFFDPILSKDGTVSCATCHDLMNGGDDGLPFSFGIQGKKGNINAPTVYNSVYNFRQFWNGRAKDLKEQAKGPIENPKEMGHTLQGAVETLKQNSEYTKLFSSIYHDGITQENIVDAIAEFEKGLITPNAPFDRYLKGDENAISPQAKKGYQLFVSKGCIICHHGINVGGNFYNKFGIFRDFNSSDKGRLAITGREEDAYVYKVPSLRNVALTAPYLHDGSAKTLKDVVVVMTQYQLGREMSPEEIDAIVAFLRSLTAPLREKVKRYDKAH
jgi:cytochrome c peroxidase